MQMYKRRSRIIEASLMRGLEGTTPGDGEIRTLDPLLARQVLSQLSYTPICLVTN